MSAMTASKDLSLPPEWFDRWWEPAEFVMAVDVHKKQFRLFETMYLQELKPLREAWAASRFADILSQDRPVSIKLEADRFPDFNLKVHDKILPFELIEAYQQGRRRDQEYRNAAARKAARLPPIIEQFDPDAEEAAAIRAIALAIEKKAKKRYSTAPNLLVYVNFSCMTDEAPITSLQAFQFAERWSNEFQSCWLLWQDCIIRLWPNAAIIRDSA